ncbi:hypothetical protein MMC16_005138 [Acarospora aff. strigata]|nr:hypothetical protein [Acarospora aff. strigata]
MVSDRRKANLSNGNGASTDDETRTKPYHDEASPGPSEDRQTATTASHDEADKGPTRKPMYPRLHQEEAAPYFDLHHEHLLEKLSHTPSRRIMDLCESGPPPQGVLLPSRGSTTTLRAATEVGRKSDGLRLT